MNQRTCFACAVSSIVLAMCGSTPGVEHHALLIAVSRYGQADIQELPGAINDVLGLQRVLVREYRFPEANIELLTNEQATLAGIRQAMQRLRSRCRPGDTAVLHFSGHGLSIPDDNGDEAQRTVGDLDDESLVPFDGTRHGDNVMRDDELGIFLDSLPAGELVVTLDSCFSGTATKSLGGSRSTVRTLGSARGRAGDKSTNRVTTSQPSSLAQEFLTRLDGAGSPGSQRRIVFSACDATQKAREIELDYALHGLQVGAFSHLFVEGLHSAADANGDGVVTYAEVFRHVNRRMDEVVNRSDSDFSNRQNPRVEYSEVGLDQAPVLAMPNKRPLFIRILAVDGRQVRLDAGAIHGTLIDQVWGLYQRVEDIGAADRVVGKLRITAIDPEESSAQLLQDGAVSQDLLVAPLVNPLARADVFLFTEIQQESPTSNVQLAQRLKLVLDRRLMSMPKIRTGAEKGYDLRLTLRQNATNVVDQYEILVELRDARDLQLASLREVLSIRLLEAEEQQANARLWKPIEDRIRELRLRQSWASLTNPQPSFHLQLVMDRVSPDGRSLPTYQVGQTAKFGLKATADCRYLLIAVDPSGEARLLTPEPMFAPSGMKLLYPGPGQMLPLSGPAGVYVVKLLALKRRPEPWRIPNGLPSPAWFRELPSEEWTESSISYRVLP